MNEILFGASEGNEWFMDVWILVCLNTTCVTIKLAHGWLNLLDKEELSRHTYILSIQRLTPCVSDDDDDFSNITSFPDETGTKVKLN